MPIVSVPATPLPCQSSRGRFRPAARFLGAAAGLFVVWASSALATTYTVRMTGFQFVPRNLTVDVGDTVTWTNLDQAAHTTTSGTNGIPSGLWDSGYLGPHGHFSFTFNVAPGYYGYYCTPHVFSFNMVGSVTVIAPNQPPSVTITNPPDGATFDLGTDITMQADATDPDGTVSQVEFFVNNASAGIVTNAPYDLVLTNLAIGSYTLGAVATDNLGATSAAPAVTISVIQPTIAPAIVAPPLSQTQYVGTNVTLTVTASGTPPLTYQWQFNTIDLADATNSSLTLSNLQISDSGNYSVIVSNSAGSVTSAPAVLTVTLPPNQIPVVTITAPPDQTRVPSGSNLAITADASDPDGDPVQVEFFVGATSIGVVTNPPYAVVLQNVAPGDYVLTAQATDSRGAVTNSAPIHVRAFVPETVAPGIKITNGPPNYAQLSSPLITASGTAGDNVGLDHVEYQLNGGPFTPASGTTAWTLQTTLAAGNNVLVVRSVDLAGNVSIPVARLLNYAVKARISIQTTGQGLVVPNLDGQMLVIGQSYTVGARPSPGQVFLGWPGQAPYVATLSFIMQSNLVLAANFAPNPFPAVRGAYAGLFRDTNGVIPADSGSLSLTLGSSGTFSGTLAAGGARYPLSGQFDPTGHLTLPVLRRGQTPVVLTLQLDLTAGSGQLTGSTLIVIGANLLTSEVQAARDVFMPPGAAAPQAGRRSFLLERLPGDGGATVGTGSIQISSGGQVAATGQLGDGRRFSSTSLLAADGSAPFYVSLSSGAEEIIGWLQLGSGRAGGVAGELSWVKSATNGFSTQLLAVPGP